MICLRSADDNSVVVSDGSQSESNADYDSTSNGTPSTDLSNLLDVRSNPSQP